MMSVYPSIQANNFLCCCVLLMVIKLALVRHIIDILFYWMCCGPKVGGHDKLVFDTVRDFSH